MPAAPVLATHARGGRITAHRLGVRAADRETGAAVPGAADLLCADAAWSTRARAGGFALELSVEACESHTRIAVAVANPGPGPRALGGVVLGLEWSAPVCGALAILHHGWDSESGSGAGALDPSAPTATHQICLVGAPDGPCALVGVYERGESFARATARAVAGGAHIDLELRVDAELAAGERRMLEEVEVAAGDEANALLESFADRWGRWAGARTWRPLPTGWHTGRLDASGLGESELLRALDSLSASRGDVRVEVVQLDDGYQRAVGDWLAADATRFPRGLAALASDIRAAGYVPGLWTAPLCAEPESDLFRARADWFLGDGSGPRPAAWPGDRAERRVFVLDATQSGVEEHLEAVYRTLVEWGFFHLNLDALSVAAAGASRDRRVGPAARLRRALAAVRRGAGDEALLLASGCPMGPAVGLVDAMRVAPEAAGRSARRTALSRVWMHRRLWLNDPGRLPCRAGGSPPSPPEWRAQAQLISETGGILFADGDPATAAPEERKVLRDTLREVRSLDAKGLPGVARLAQPLDPGAHARVVLDEPAHLWTSALAVFCDFDGTFSVQDVGSTLAARFAADRRPAQWARYERGEITPWEYNLEILDGLPVGTDVLDAFLASVELDPGARDLVAWCRAQAVPFRVVSDGFDWNLNRLQSLHRVRFAYSANHLRIEHGRWRISPGGPDPTCGCGTGTCKRAVLRAYRATRPTAHLVHIGNGRVSDSCGALAADTAFAKDSLAEWLEQRGAPFVPFDTLSDVIPHLAAILARLAPGVASSR